MRSTLLRLILLAALGVGSLLAYLAALGLNDLRENTLGFEIAFFAAFSLYLAAVALVLRMPQLERATGLRPSAFVTRSGHLSFVIFLFALLFRLALLPTRPTLSDDMYRYVWDGRVQAHGISPYRYPPDAQELASLRVSYRLVSLGVDYDSPNPQTTFTSVREEDQAIWPHINRKSFVTVYPPGAEMAFAAIWRIVGDSVTGFKLVFVLAELLGGVLLIQLLRALGQPVERSLIYFWSPLLVFEVAHAGHVDALMLPLLILAFWARVKERPGLLGLSLGAATLIKFFPALLLPALIPLPRLWSWKGLRAPMQMLIGFSAILIAGYLPYYLSSGAGVLGFLPQYFGENFNLGLARFVFDFAGQHGLPPATLSNIITFGGVAALGLIFIFRPAASVRCPASGDSHLDDPSARAALLRCVWIIGWFTLFTQNLFPWYVLWLLPLLALFVEPGKLFGLRLAPLSAWLIFSGTVALSYLFFIRWRVIPTAQAAEYGPLYGLLLVPFLSLRRMERIKRMWMEKKESAPSVPSAD